MIQVNGSGFADLSHPIYVNRKRVREVWVDGVMVYPATEGGGGFLRFAMYFEFSSDIVSNYSSSPVNRYGAYIKADGQETRILRAAFSIRENGESVERRAFATLRDYGMAAGSLTYVPYVALGDSIVAEGLSHSEINTFALTENVRDGKYYYATSTINANLQDSQGRLLTGYTVSTGSDNCRVFYSDEEAIGYVLG